MTAGDAATAAFITEEAHFRARLFCLAVMRPGSRVSVLTVTNAKLMELALEQALRDGCAFYVDAVAGLLVADFDRSTAETDAARLYLWLRLRGLWPVLVASGVEGHRHVYCRVPSALWDEAVAKAKGVGADAPRNAIRPPFVPHRLQHQGVPPAQPLLPEDPDEAPTRIAGHMPTRRGFGADVLAAVEHGDEQSVSNSERVYRAAMAAVNAQWSFEGFELLCRTPGTALHAAFDEREHERGEPETALWLRDDWTRAVRRVRESRAVRAGDQATPWALYYRALDEQWPGRSANHLAVYLALLEIAARAGTLAVTASERQLALATGVARGTVRRALDGLEGRGLVVAGTPTAAAGEAALWELQVPDDLDMSRRAFPPPGDTERVCWRNGSGLGSLARVVHVLLHKAGPTTEQALAKRLGIQLRTARTHLGVLAEHGLARQADDGRWQRGEVTPDEVGRLLDLARHRAKRQAESYQRDRVHHTRGRLAALGRGRAARRPTAPGANETTTDTPPP